MDLHWNDTNSLPSERDSYYGLLEAHARLKDIDPAENMVSVGDGTIDFAGILADPVASGIRHCFVEHDNPEDPFRSVAASHFAMKSILG